MFIVMSPKRLSIDSAGGMCDRFKESCLIYPEGWSPASLCFSLLFLFFFFQISVAEIDLIPSFLKSYSVVSSQRIPKRSHHFRFNHLAGAPAVCQASCYTFYRQDLVSSAVLRRETHPYSHLVDEEVEA